MLIKNHYSSEMEIHGSRSNQSADAAAGSEKQNEKKKTKSKSNKRTKCYVCRTNIFVNANCQREAKKQQENQTLIDNNV